MKEYVKDVLIRVKEMVELRIYECCPSCSTKLEGITGEDMFVLAYYCRKCGIHWDLNDLEIVGFSAQKKMDGWL